MSTKKVKILRKGSGTVQRDVMTMDMSIYAKCVYCLLITYTGGKTSCYPSLNTIIKNLNISKFSVLKAISELEEKELLFVKRRTKDSKQNMVNEYIPNMIYDEIEVEEKVDKGSACDEPPSACDEPGVVREADRKNNSIKNNIEDKEKINKKDFENRDKSRSSQPGKKEYTFDQKLDFFLKIFNETKGVPGKPAQYKAIDKVRQLFRARLKDGYTSKDFKEAIQNCKNSEHHKQYPHLLIPSFILRSEKLEMYLNKKDTEVTSSTPMSNSEKRRLAQSNQQTK